MPSKRVVYECKYCGKDFAIWGECEEHEKSHLRDYRQADTNEIIRELKWLSDHAYGYHVGNLVGGIPVSNFENLMDEAAKRLEGKSRWRILNRAISAEKHQKSNIGQVEE